jgi:ethanolamine utilization protein EutA
MSPQAVKLLQSLHIERTVGDNLSAADVSRIVDFYVQLIESSIAGQPGQGDSAIVKLHVQVPLVMAREAQPPTITLSGGVGQLVYDRLRGHSEAAVTRFGDLGDELATRLARSPAIVRRMGSFVPEGLGRATVYGLLRHGTELSGSTLYLPRPECLPLKNVPIVGRISEQTIDDELRRVVALATRSAQAGCVRVDIDTPTLETVRRLGERVFEALRQSGDAPGNTLVLLLSNNLGKTLGNYITRWGTRAADLIVIDEIAPQRDAQLLRLGRVREGIVPVSLYGMN